MHIIRSLRLLVSLWRLVCQSFRRTLLRCYGIKISSTAVIHSTAVVELSGGQISIGAGTYIDRGVIIRALGGRVQIGEECSINAYSVLLGSGGIKIGRGTRVAPHCVIVAGNHKFRDPNVYIKHQGLDTKGIEIGSDVWLGAGTKVLDGVIIGLGSVVGAGSVVTRSIPVFRIVAGVPAREIGVREE